MKKTSTILLFMYFYYYIIIKYFKINNWTVNENFYQK